MQMREEKKPKLVRGMTGGPRLVVAPESTPELDAVDLDLLEMPREEASEMASMPSDLDWMPSAKTPSDAPRPPKLPCPPKPIVRGSSGKHFIDPTASAPSCTQLDSPVDLLCCSLEAPIAIAKERNHHAVSPSCSPEATVAVEMHQHAINGLSRGSHGQGAAAAVTIPFSVSHAAEASAASSNLNGSQTTTQDAAACVMSSLHLIDRALRAEGAKAIAGSIGLHGGVAALNGGSMDPTELAAHLNLNVLESCAGSEMGKALCTALATSGASVPATLWLEAHCASLHDPSHLDALMHVLQRRQSQLRDRQPRAASEASGAESVKTRIRAISAIDAAAGPQHVCAAAVPQASDKPGSRGSACPLRTHGSAPAISLSTPVGGSCSEVEGAISKDSKPASSRHTTRSTGTTSWVLKRHVTSPVWMYCRDSMTAPQAGLSRGKRWFPMYADMQNDLECAWQIKQRADAGEMQGLICMMPERGDRWQYAVDFDRMEQTNVKCGTVRKIKRMVFGS